MPYAISNCKLISSFKNIYCDKFNSKQFFLINIQKLNESGSFNSWMVKGSNFPSNCGTC